jgi:Right handed beta helix region
MLTLIARRRLLFCAANTLAAFSPARVFARRVVDEPDLKFSGIDDHKADNTAEVQAMLDSAKVGQTVLLPAGRVFVCHALRCRTSLTLQIDGVLKFAAQSGALLTIENVEDFSLVGSGHVDLSNTQDKGILLNGCHHAKLRGITFQNMLGGPSTTGSSAAVNAIRCNNILIENLRFLNIRHGQPASQFVSQPRGISLDFCKEATLSHVIAENVYAPFVVAGCQDVSINDSFCKRGSGTVDNCFYLIRSKNIAINNPTIISWAGEPIVFSHTENVVVNDGKILDGTKNSCGFEGSKNIRFVNTLFAGAAMTSVLRARPGNTTAKTNMIKLIGVKVAGKLSDDVIGFYHGEVDDLEIRNCTFDVVYADGFGFRSRFLSLKNTDRFTIEDNEFILREESEAPSGDYSVTLNCRSRSTFLRNRLINMTRRGRLRVNGLGNNFIVSDL